MRPLLPDRAAQAIKKHPGLREPSGYKRKRGLAARRAPVTSGPPGSGRALATHRILPKPNWWARPVPATTTDKSHAEH
jgi:hypothetical protein